MISELKVDATETSNSGCSSRLMLTPRESGGTDPGSADSSSLPSRGSRFRQSSSDSENRAGSTSSSSR